MSVVDVVVELHVDTSGTLFSTVHHEMVKEMEKKHCEVLCSQLKESDLLLS